MVHVFILKRNEIKSLGERRALHNFLIIQQISFISGLLAFVIYPFILDILRYLGCLRTGTNNRVPGKVYLVWEKIVIHKFFSLEIVNDFDLEPDTHTRHSSSIQNMQFCIFSWSFQFYLERIRNIHRILLTKITELEKRYGG